MEYIFVSIKSENVKAFLERAGEHVTLTRTIKRTESKTTYNIYRVDKDFKVKPQLIHWITKEATDDESKKPVKIKYSTEQNISVSQIWQQQINKTKNAKKFKFIP